LHSFRQSLAPSLTLPSPCAVLTSRALNRPLAAQLASRASEIASPIRNSTFATATRPFGMLHEISLGTQRDLPGPSLPIKLIPITPINRRSSVESNRIGSNQIKSDAGQSPGSNGSPDSAPPQSFATAALCQLPFPDMLRSAPLCLALLGPDPPARHRSLRSHPLRSHPLPAIRCDPMSPFVTSFTPKSTLLQMILCFHWFRPKRQALASPKLRPDSDSYSDSHSAHEQFPSRREMVHGA
jgi:hypothetical protein